MRVTRFLLAVLALTSIVVVSGRVASADDSSTTVSQYLGARSRAITSGAASDRSAATDAIAVDNQPLRDFVASDLANLHRVVNSHGPLVGVQVDYRYDGRSGSTFYVYEKISFTWRNEGAGRSDRPSSGTQCS